MLTALPILPLATLSQYIFGPLLFLVSLFMILIILVQRGKGGGLTGALGGPGGQSVFGSKAGDLFTRITVVLATVWIFLLAFAVWWYNEDSLSSALAGTDENVPSMTSKPGTPETGAASSSAVTPNVGEVAPIELGSGDAATGDMLKGLSGGDAPKVPETTTDAATATPTSESTPAAETAKPEVSQPSEMTQKPSDSTSTTPAEKSPEVAPKIEAPATEAPKVESPKLELPAVESPAATAPAAPTLEAPTAPAK
ncbi:MAG: preprotein translocase subunit SecG [Planctomycetota bacterium]|nr:preprotein translocase subunit SecG [Planctomycetota bacterium]